MLVTIATQSTSGGLSTSDALVALLTMETLLFAAFGVASFFASSTEYGRDLITSAGMFAYAIAAAVTLVGIGAGVAWIDAYTAPSASGCLAWIAGGTLMAGIVAQAAFSWWIATALARNDG